MEAFKRARLPYGDLPMVVAVIYLSLSLQQNMPVTSRGRESELPLTAAPLECSPETSADITDGRKGISPPMKFCWFIKNANLRGVVAQASNPSTSTGEAEVG